MSTQLNSTQLNSTQLNSTQLKSSRVLTGLAITLLSFTTLNAEASLTGGIADGQSVVYSSISNVTWTGDGNLLGTLEASNPNLVNTIISTIGSISDTPNFNDTPANSGSHTLSTADFGGNGLVSWFGAQAYTKYLNTINYAGSNQWALSSAGANPQSGYNETFTQLGQLFYNELGGVAGSAIPNTANFTNEQSSAYWSGMEYAPIPGLAWVFSTNYGVNYNSQKHNQFYAWAVSPGPVSAVPVPGALWLFGSGLIGLLSFKRRGNIG